LTTTDSRIASCSIYDFPAPSTAMNGRRSASQSHTGSRLETNGDSKTFINFKDDNTMQNSATVIPLTRTKGTGCLTAGLSTKYKSSRGEIEDNDAEMEEINELDDGDEEDFLTMPSPSYSSARLSNSLPHRRLLAIHQRYSSWPQSQRATTPAEPRPLLSSIFRLVESAADAVDSCRGVNVSAELFWLRSQMSAHWTMRWFWKVAKHWARRNIRLKTLNRFLTLRLHAKVARKTGCQLWGRLCDLHCY
jgi:hypothetical protein